VCVYVRFALIFTYVDQVHNSDNYSCRPQNSCPRIFEGSEEKGKLPLWIRKTFGHVCVHVHHQFSLISRLISLDPKTWKIQQGTTCQASLIRCNLMHGGVHTAPKKLSMHTGTSVCRLQEWSTHSGMSSPYSLHYVSLGPSFRRTTWCAHVFKTCKGSGTTLSTIKLSFSM
jgi:hypothetical protein